MNDEDNLIRMHWAVIRGAQWDMLNGRPDMDAAEEIAMSSNALDELLDYPEARKL